MKILPKCIAGLAIIMAAQLTTGCGSVGGSEGERKAGYSENAEAIYRMGYELGARDRLNRLPSDYTRHLRSFDSPFVAQFESGYVKGYGT